jgi:hypothetical protein
VLDGIDGKFMGLFLKRISLRIWQMGPIGAGDLRGSAISGESAGKFELKVGLRYFSCVT